MQEPIMLSKHVQAKISICQRCKKEFPHHPDRYRVYCGMKCTRDGMRGRMSVNAEGYNPEMREQILAWNKTITRISKRENV
jgi:hypothetical protein